MYNDSDYFYHVYNIHWIEYNIKYIGRQNTTISLNILKLYIYVNLLSTMSIYRIMRLSNFYNMAISAF